MLLPTSLARPTFGTQLLLKNPPVSSIQLDGLQTESFIKKLDAFEKEVFAFQ